MLKALRGRHGRASRTGHRHPRVLRPCWVDVHDSFCRLSHNPQCHPIPIRCPSHSSIMSKHEAYASMTSASSSRAPNRVRACPNCSPDRPRSYSSEDSHKTPILLEPESTTLPRPQSPPDPRKHRSISNTSRFLLTTHCSPITKPFQKVQSQRGQSSSPIRIHPAPFIPSATFSFASQTAHQHLKLGPYHASRDDTPSPMLPRLLFGDGERYSPRR